MSHKYIIHFSGEKRVDDWDPEQGAAGKDRNADNNGKYLADYDVYVTGVPTQNPVPVGHLGLKSIDGQ